MDFDGLKHYYQRLLRHLTVSSLANTTRQRDGLTSANKVEEGGLSGRPLFERN